MPRSVAIKFVLAVLAVASLAGKSAGQSEIYVVSPGELESVEGNRRVPAGDGPGKYQGLYYAKDFLSLPDTHRMITGFAWRPDGSNPFTDPITCPVRYLLSTTDAEGLSSTFADNLGDDTTVVFDGTVTWQDQSSGSVPRDFDFYVPFDVPFAYDPSEGNLVLHMEAPADCSQVGNWYIDERELSTGPITAVAGAISARSARVAHRTIFVAQFEFVAEPSDVAGDLNNDGLCDVADIDLLTVEVLSGEHDARFDLNADGLVNQDDRVVFIEVLKSTYFGDANLDGEFNSADFVQVFQAGEYEDGVTGNSTWSTGDWNGDTDFDSGDFVQAFQAGGYEVGPLASPVPEPSAQLLLTLGIWLIGTGTVNRKGT